MVSRAKRSQIEVGDAVRVPWGVGEVTGEVVDIYGDTAPSHAVVRVPVSGASGETLESETLTVRTDVLRPIHGEVVAERDTTPAGMDGWTRLYRVHLNTGEEVPVNVWASGTAVAMAPHDAELRDFVRDLGRAWAVRVAERAQPIPDIVATIRGDSSGIQAQYEIGSAPRRRSASSK